MHRYLLCCALLLAACGDRPAKLAILPPSIPADLLQPEAGWQGGAPRDEGELSDALVATQRGLGVCNLKLGAIADSLTTADR